MKVYVQGILGSIRFGPKLTLIKATLLWQMKTLVTSEIILKPIKKKQENSQCLKCFQISLENKLSIRNCA